MKKVCFAIVNLTILSLLLYGCGQPGEEIDNGIESTDTEAADLWTPTKAPTDNPAPTRTFTPAPSNTPTPEPLCIPGETLFDEEGDIDIAHADLLKIESHLEGGVLTVVFYLREIPVEIEINREGVDTWDVEYSWSAYIDVDHDTSTGDQYHQGADYALFTAAAKEGFQKTANFQSVFYNGFSVCGFEADGSMYPVSSGVLAVDYENGTITMEGIIPGITANSHLFFETFDMNPDAAPVTDSICN
ncbi:MAG: hypothetical protein JXA25_20005 [Anaerolineales bacterium]|nr:hypothetical protein [Anaerolineales bacterium]